MKARGISLANKCQLLFGAAVVLILTAALAVPWIRMDRMIERGERETARQLADAWLQNVIILGSVPETGFSGPTLTETTGQDSTAGDQSAASDRSVLHIEAITPEEAELRAEQMPDPMLRRALTAFREDPQSPAMFEVTHTLGQPVRYRYMRPITAAEVASIQDPGFARLESDLPNPGIGNPLRRIMIIERNAVAATGQLFINRTYIVLSGIFAGSLAILVFYFITTRLIISPVRVLRDTTERVSQGDLNVRSDISTGDEFEELSDMFNQMLASLKSTQDQLRQMNKSLDLKLADLARSNVMLLESNRLKSEFLANVSHELRTPLNSIIGFAEVVAEIDDHHQLESEDRFDQATHEKRQRYIKNILISGRSLLQMINDLLDLARIEAGRVEIQPEVTDVVEVCNSLATLIRPQADRKNITVAAEIAPTLPAIETDPGKFQQIIFNFLSNAVKFTPEHGRIVLKAQRWREHSRESESIECVRVSVADTGFGISEEDQKLIFEKFRQVDASHTRQHQGTGLGLAICRELSNLLGGTIEVESQAGHGSTFSLTLPIKRTVVEPQPLMPITDTT